MPSLPGAGNSDHRDRCPTDGGLFTVPNRVCDNRVVALLSLKNLHPLFLDHGDLMSDQSGAGCFRGRRAGARWVLVALVIGRWVAGCGMRAVDVGKGRGCFSRGAEGAKVTIPPRQKLWVGRPSSSRRSRAGSCSCWGKPFERDGRFDPGVSGEVARPISPEIGCTRETDAGGPRIGWTGDPSQERVFEDGRRENTGWPAAWSNRSINWSRIGRVVRMCICISRSPRSTRGRSRQDEGVDGGRVPAGRPVHPAEKPVAL
ncbi:MAG: hypothetical protein Ct9H300mP1_23310 [Planctomycetaceae bacterium]|nr:MAG: hypothetical protein Ct9H300mP1_23310 [Planctomycetaceae bacterium]